MIYWLQINFLPKKQIIPHSLATREWARNYTQSFKFQSFFPIFSTHFCSSKKLLSLRALPSPSQSHSSSELRIGQKELETAEGGLKLQQIRLLFSLNSPNLSKNHWYVIGSPYSSFLLRTVSGLFIMYDSISYSFWTARCWVWWAFGCISVGWTVDACSLNFWVVLAGNGNLSSIVLSSCFCGLELSLRELILWFRFSTFFTFFFSHNFWVSVSLG